MKKLFLICVLSIFSFGVSARTSISLSIPLVFGAPVYTQSVPVYTQRVPVYTQPVRSTMCWNDYYGQWENCAPAPFPAPMPVYNTYVNPPIVTFGYSNSYYDRRHYDHNHHDNYRQGHNYHRR